MAIDGGDQLGVFFDAGLSPAGEAAVVLVLDEREVAAFLDPLDLGRVGSAQIGLATAEELGEDVIRTGDGGALVFADAINADWMLEEEAFRHHLGDGAQEGGGYETVAVYLSAVGGIEVEEVSPDLLVGFVHDHLMRFIEESSSDPRGGSDRIYAGAGEDWIVAQGGDDVIYLSGGENHVWGGSGADRFVFLSSEGHTTLHDFSEEDRLDLSRLAAPEDLRISQAGEGAAFSLSLAEASRPFLTLAETPLSFEELCAQLGIDRREALGR